MKTYRVIENMSQFLLALYGNRVLRVLHYTTERPKTHLNVIGMINDATSTICDVKNRTLFYNICEYDTLKMFEKLVVLHMYGYTTKLVLILFSNIYKTGYEKANFRKNHLILIYNQNFISNI